MTKKEANLIKGILKHECVMTYYNSKKQEFRVMVYEIIDGVKGHTPDWQKHETNAICKVLTKIQKEARPKFRLERKRYQGFINRTYIVFE